MTELKPKPVRCGCGGEAKVFTYDALSGEQLYYVNCTKCGICTSSKLTKAEAVEAWNRAIGGNVQDCAKVARCSDPDDLISRRDAIDAMMALKQEDDESYGCEIPEGFDGKRAVEALEKLPSAEPERNIIRCADCKWWDRLEEGHPYGYCLACRSGTHTERWEISIYRQCKYDFYCADAEPIEEEDDDEDA